MIATIPTRFWGACGLALVAFAAPLAAAEPMIKVRLSGGLVEGRPLFWSDRQVDLLARDGQLVVFRPEQARDYRESAPRFFSYTPSEMRARLYGEFGSGVEVTGTGHYLVVHPKGQKDKWAQRFEDLYRAFYAYFKVRGLKVRDAPFPLVAVVFPTQQEYRAYAAVQGENVPQAYLGHYSRLTNRIYLFDLTAGKSRGDWSQNAETIIHEATHQTAFNTGVHGRFSSPPRWLTEGLATMFEARGVWNAASYRSQRDRLNQGRLADFKDYLKTRPPDALADLIASDKLFESRPVAAYAQAWALSFYLCETRPQQYARYLAQTARREEFIDYPAEERVADFTAAFGNNLGMLDAQFLRYLARVR